jgi:hypothetical protein
MKSATIYYNISNINTSASSITGSEVILKGRTSVNFVLTGISEDVTNALYLKIDYGDITPVVYMTKPAVFDYTTSSIFDEILYGKVGGTILSIYPHEYINSTDYAGIRFNATFSINFDNGKNIELIQPICLYCSSFYDDLQSVTAINTQIIPISSNDTFLNLESLQSNTIYPTILST